MTGDSQYLACNIKYYLLSKYKKGNSKIDLMSNKNFKHGSDWQPSQTHIARRGFYLSVWLATVHCRQLQ